MYDSTAIPFYQQALVNTIAGLASRNNPPADTIVNLLKKSRRKPLSRTEAKLSGLTPWLKQDSVCRMIAGEFGKLTGIPPSLQDVSRFIDDLADSLQQQTFCESIPPVVMRGKLIVATGYRGHFAGTQIASIKIADKVYPVNNWGDAIFSAATAVSFLRPCLFHLAVNIVGRRRKLIAKDPKELVERYAPESKPKDKIREIEGTGLWVMVGIPANNAIQLVWSLLEYFDIEGDSDFELETGGLYSFGPVPQLKD